MSNWNVFLLNIITDINCKKIRHVLVHIITAARICFVKYWKKEDTPTNTDIIVEILATAEMDSLSERLKEDPDYNNLEAWNVV